MEWAVSLGCRERPSGSTVCRIDLFLELGIGDSLRTMNGGCRDFVASAATPN